MIARSIQSRHPVLAHIIPVRRCNLSCAYCNEYDKVSNPVATAEMLRRIEMLAGWARKSSRSAAGNRCCIPTSTKSFAASAS